MPAGPVFPTIDDIIAAMGDTGTRLAGMGASEGAAGNLSVFLGWPVEAGRYFPEVQVMELPVEAEALAGGSIVITGSGRRLRDLEADPAANLAVVTIDSGGKTARLHTSPRRLFDNLSVEFEPHLAVHADRVERAGLSFHALIHTQPVHLTYLTHIPAYRDQTLLNQRLFRWQGECIVFMPEGMGLLPFMLSGSAELTEATVAQMREHRIVLWAKHGVMARSDVSIKQACDLVDYAETSARYECLNLSTGEPADGLSEGEIRAICKAAGVDQQVF